MGRFLVGRERGQFEPQVNHTCNPVWQILGGHTILWSIWTKKPSFQPKMCIRQKWKRERLFENIFNQNVLKKTKQDFWQRWAKPLYMVMNYSPVWLASVRGIIIRAGSAGKNISIMYIKNNQPHGWFSFRSLRKIGFTDFWKLVDTIFMSNFEEENGPISSLVLRYHRG